VIVRDFDALAVCGPTAAGKSEAAVLVAELLGGEIVNADSRQVYRDMTIGTCAPSAASLRRVPHHLYAFVDPCRRYSAGEYVIDARSACDAIVSRGNLPIIVGGTGFYVDTLRGVRAEASTHPHEALREWLAAMSPDAAAKVTPGDRYRTLRAIEGVLARRSVSPPDPHMPIAPAPRVRVAVLAVETRELARRISSRVREMFDRGLVDEAISIAARCVDAPALTGLGYAEALGYVRGEITRDEAIRSAIARTCRYAKRQRTWFRRMRDALVVEGDDPRRSAEAIAEFARGTAQNT
jgi:tRNA dimethylallyltransferase